MVPEQIGVVPLIIPGVAGIAALAVTAKVFAELLQVALFAITVIFPLVAEATPVMEVTVDVPVHPPGKVQV